MAALVELNDLCVTFETPAGPVRAVRGVTLHVDEGEILGVVGESGCGKSVTFRAMLGLNPASSTVSGTASFDGESIETDGAMCAHASMIYQNPGAALNPVFTIGQQLRLVAGTNDPDQLAKLLEDVGLPNPREALGAYPHEFSGGMRQRAVVAYALAQKPSLLIADEPTTALDVTTQAQVLDLIKSLQVDQGLSVVLISHDLGVIRRICDRVAVIYAGRVVEVGDTTDVLTNPAHPYTQALLASIPRASHAGGELVSIDGSVPDGRTLVEGCSYAPRCPQATEACLTATPPMVNVAGTGPVAEGGHGAACVLVDQHADRTENSGTAT
ncbi:MAG: ABC transporter ATP-binding protein [Acidimicrobiales bacterium]